MNVIFFYNLIAANGWRWRFEIITPDTTLLSNPQYVEIPENVISADITWQAKFPNAAIGLCDTPSVKMTFNMANLEGSAELLGLRQRLDAPFLQFDAPFANVPDYTYEWFNPETAMFETVTVPGYSAKVRTIRLSNVLRVMTNYGNNAVTFNDLFGTDANAQSTAMVFSGIQTMQPPSTYNHKQKTLTIEFMHLNRYVLEQINPSMVDAQISLIAPYITNSVIIHAWKDSVSTRRIELHETTGDEESYESDNIFLWKTNDFFTALSTLFREIRKYLIRQDGFTFTSFNSYLDFARFYRQNLDNGQKAAMLDVSDLYFIGKVFSSNADDNTPELVAGTFSESSKFYEFKNMFDFMVDMFENGLKSFFYEFSMFGQPLYSTLELPPNGAEELSEDVISLDDESERQYAALAGYEAAVNDTNIVATVFGRALVDETYNFTTYFHNVFRDWEYSFCPQANSPATVKFEGYGVNADQLEGQLFYVDSGKVYAVHPACDFAESISTFAQDAFITQDTISQNSAQWINGTSIFSPIDKDAGFARIEEKFAEYTAKWLGSIGIVRHIGYQCVSQLSSDKQRKFGGVYYLRKGTIVSGSPVIDISMPMPRNVGRRYTLATGFFDAWLQVPQDRVFLLSSECDIVRGITKNEFFAQDTPITFIPL